MFFRFVEVFLIGALIPLIALFNDIRSDRHNDELIATQHSYLQAQLDVQEGMGTLQAQAIISESDSAKTEIAESYLELESTRSALENGVVESTSVGLIFVPTNTRTATYTVTSTVTPTVTETQLPTITPTITETPSPTNTPSPTSTFTPEAIILFSDNFEEDHLKPEWTVTNGSVVFVNGWLTALDNEVALRVGNDYPQTFDFELDYSNFSTSRGVIITFWQKIRFIIESNNSSWYVFQDNQWYKLYGSGGGGREGHLRISVDGNKYQVFINDTILHEITYENSERGPIAILVYDDRYIDNFVISTKP